MDSKKVYLTAQEVSELLGVSKTKAYTIIRSLNNELEAEGYIVVSGKVARKRLEERYYGLAL